VIKTPLTRWFDLSTPIIGAPMAGVSGGAMARAVSEAGGLGMIGVSGAHRAEFVTEQCAIPAEAEVPFGVGLMVWVLDDRPELFEATIAAQPSLVSVSFGDPAPYVGPLHDAGIAVASQVNTAADVARALDAGVDVLVAQGTEAGGHTGTVATMALVPQVVDAVGANVPVVAAGGLFDGRGLAASLALGADGVWVGTRFIATPEARAVKGYKEALLDTPEDGTVVSRAYTGKTCRVVRNEWTQHFEEHPGELEPFPGQVIASMRAGANHLGAADGTDVDVAREFMPCGQGVGAIHELVPAATLVQQMLEEAERAIDRIIGLRV
jgi:NAD(P)H-dependent flavin oxidoreductase YrpB (nitropropane dioxygenase family)